MKQQNAGSLANFCPSCEFAESDVSGTEPEVELGHSRWKNRREEDRIVDNGVIPVCEYIESSIFFPMQNILNYCHLIEFIIIQIWNSYQHPDFKPMV